MLFSAELPWCLVFVQKSNFQKISWKMLEKSYFTRRPTEPEYETKRGKEGTTPPGGTAQAWPRQGVVWPPQPSPRAPFRLHIPSDLKLSGILAFFPR
jgi:hypothetical protein